MEDLLISMPILYITVNEADDSQSSKFVYKGEKEPENYTYSVGVTLDYLPEDNIWVASYSDLLEAPGTTPKSALEALRERIVSSLAS